MIEATCSACGTLNRVSEANVPPGAKFITCGDCKSRIAITPPPPAPPAAKLPPPLPTAAKPPPGALDLTDLPAPKRPSALGPLPPAPTPVRPAPAPPRPPARGGVAAARDPELPAPKATRSASAPAPAEIDFDEAITGTPAVGGGVVDLPAPKRPAPRAPSGEAARDEIIDLPAPKLDREADLLAPKSNARRPIADLPAPRDPAKDAAKPPARDSSGGAAARSPAPPVSSPGVPGAPSAPSAPSAPGSSGPMIADLPSPRAHDAAAGAPLADLPAPKGFFDDLPQPAPRDRPDLPAPKGYFEDLPTVKSNPRAAAPDLPAPKGYFEDLPTVKSRPTGGGTTDVPAPKGFFDDIPGLPNTARPEVPAPKGYFDDIPGLPSTARPEVPAPKGYFDDIPGLPSTPKAEVPAPKGFFDDIPGLPNTARPEAPAPKGFFDDIPGLPRVAKPEVPAPKGFFDDLPQPGRAPSTPPVAEPDLELAAGPELDLQLPAGAASADAASARPPSSFDDLDLARPSAPPVRFDAPARPTPARPTPTDARPAEHGPVLELEAPPAGSMARVVAQRPSKPQQAAAPAPTADSRRRRSLLVIAALVALALGGGGFVLYRRHVAAVERTAAIAEQLAAARTAYGASDARHWQRAAAAARQVVELDETNAEALGIGAESLLASALDDGTAAQARIAQAHAMLDTANSSGLSSPVLTRARALAALAAHQPDAALTQLQPLAGKALKDPTLALYIGWARAAKGDAAGAIQAYDVALGSPSAKLAALYGRGNAKLDLADLDGARADFTAVLELAKDHIAAQVGLAAAVPPAAAQRRESDLLAILARKDIATADPRAVARAWTLAGDAAMRAGRYDIARERFRKALALSADDLAATAGLAATELRDGKVPTAAGLTAKALGVAKDNVAAQLVQSEIEIKQRRYQLARQRLDALAARPTPLAPLELARLQLVQGKLLDALGKPDEAAESYIKAARTARGLDLEPMVAAVGKLTALARVALADHDAPRAEALRKRTDELLGNFADQAAKDPLLALTLGIGYLQAGNADKAEPWLRQAVEARPQDAEARFQLGRALLQSERPQDALDALRAAFALDAARIDIAAELARTYEAIQRDADAGALYTKLLAGPEPGLELRARAGRFFARTGAIDKAAEQGAKILAVDPRDAAGLYLRGEGLLAAGKPAEAKAQFQRASEIDRDPQYLDALGRAAEALGRGGDREAQEAALRAYAEAADAAPGMLNPFLGQGRLYLLRRDPARAVPPLSAAMRLRPNDATIMALLGAAYQDSQRPAEAHQWLSDAVKAAPNAEAYWRLGQIERDANRGPQALSALASATRLAADAESHGSKPIPWLTEALYLQGRVGLDLHNEAAARAAWILYVARNPPASAQLTEVKQQLATALQ